MVTRDTAWPGGTPCWVDLGADDIDKATAFYRGLFGWDIPPGPPEAGGYSIALLRGRPRRDRAEDGPGGDADRVDHLPRRGQRG